LEHLWRNTRRHAAHASIGPRAGPALYHYGGSVDAARIKHGYDRVGNRLWREDTVAAANSKNFDELYAYDGIYRLSDFQRGNLNSSDNGIDSGTLNFEQDWASIRWGTGPASMRIRTATERTT